MFKWMTIIFLSVLSWGVQAKEPWCDRVEVVGTMEEKDMICRGLSKARAFYVEHHIELPADIEPFRVVFKPAVTMPSKDSAGNATFLGGTRVLALFDRGSRTLEFTSMNEPWLRSKGRTFFKLPYNDMLYESVSMHEMMHVLNKSLYKYNDYGHAQDEYIAYAAQIYSLPQPIRAKVVAQYDNEQFTDELSINDLVHFSNPHAFGVMSYLHFMGTKGGETMLRRIFNGDFKPMDLSF